MEVYSQTEWKGPQYEEVRKKRLTTTEIAKLIRKDIKKKYPKLKVSVKTEYFAGGSSINAYIKDFGFNPINPGYDPGEWASDVYNISMYTKKAENIMEEIKKIGNKYRYEDIDTMTDYFATSFYWSVGVDYQYRDKCIKQRLEKKMIK